MEKRKVIKMEKSSRVSKTSVLRANIQFKNCWIGKWLHSVIFKLVERKNSSSVAFTTAGEINPCNATVKN